MSIASVFHVSVLLLIMNVKVVVDPRGDCVGLVYTARTNFCTDKNLHGSTLRYTGPVELDGFLEVCKGAFHYAKPTGQR